MLLILWLFERDDIFSRHSLCFRMPTIHPEFTLLVPIKTALARLRLSAWLTYRASDDLRGLNV